MGQLLVVFGLIGSLVCEDAAPATLEPIDGREDASLRETVVVLVRDAAGREELICWHGAGNDARCWPDEPAGPGRPDAPRSTWLPEGTVASATALAEPAPVRLPRPCGDAGELPPGFSRRIERPPRPGA